MKYFLVVILIMVFAFGCKKNNTSYWFTGMEIIDTNGNLVKWVGQQDDDWQINKYTLNTQQLYAMTIDSLSDTASWNHTAVGNVAIIPGTNPIGWDTGTINYNFSVSFNTNAYFSYLLTDQYYTVLATHSYYGDSGSFLNVYVPITSSRVQAGGVYRLYYSFSARRNAYFAQGWGDIGVCTKDTVKHITNSCF